MSEESPKPVEFDYLLSEKNEFLVVSFIGPMDNKALAKLQTLQNEIAMNINIKFVVLNMRDISSFSGDVIQEFAQLQKNIRAGDAELRICGLRPEFKEKLTRLGILRGPEVTDNLASAIQALAALKKK